MQEFAPELSTLLDNLRNDCGGIHSPRLIPKADMDLRGFQKQDLLQGKIPIEYVNQKAGGSPSGDDFYGTIAWPIGDWFFTVEFSS